MASEKVHGQVSSSDNSSHTFQGGETLKVSAIEASRMDAPSTTLGEQQITLQAGQSFPIKFEFSYDKSGAGKGPNGLLVDARIQDKNHQLVFISDTRTPLVENVTINVVKT